jgi:hypothetical protein
MLNSGIGKGRPETAWIRNCIHLLDRTLRADIQAPAYVAFNTRFVINSHLEEEVMDEFCLCDLDCTDRTDRNATQTLFTNILINEHSFWPPNKIQIVIICVKQHKQYCY